MSTIPSDPLIKFHIQSMIRNASDLASLTRTKIKDSIAQRFKISPLDRKRFDEDEHFKKLIKLYVKEAIAERSEEGDSDDANGKEVTPSPESRKKPEKKAENNAQRSSQKDAMTPPLSNKHKSAAMKEIEARTPQESEPKRKAGSESKQNKEAKISRKSDETIRQKEIETVLSEFSSLEDSDDEKGKKKSKAPRKKARSSTTSVNGDTSSKKSSSTVGKDTSERLEARMKKLKKLVVLCGTRKIWKRLYDEAGCADPDEGDEEDEKEKIDRMKKQLAVIEDALKDLGMTAPYTQAKADEIRERKELEDDLEEIKKAKLTEKSKTRSSKSSKIHRSDSPTIIDSDDDSPSKKKSPPPLKKFRKDLASFADEINN